jgi:YgiT-type zinc finger domain-containing protein
MLESQCPTCHLGLLHQHKVTYATWFQEQFVVIPGMLNWQCDVCGETHYDEQMLDRIYLLLGRETGSRTQQAEPGYRTNPAPGRLWSQRRWSV